MDAGKHFGDHRLPSKQLKEFIAYNALKVTIARTTLAQIGLTPHTNNLRKENLDHYLAEILLFSIKVFYTFYLTFNKKSYEIHKKSRKINPFSRDQPTNITRSRDDSHIRTNKRSFKAIIIKCSRIWWERWVVNEQWEFSAAKIVTLKCFKF